MCVCSGSGREGLQKVSEECFVFRGEPEEKVAKPGREGKGRGVKERGPRHKK